MAGGGPAVLRSGGAAGAGPGEFRRTGGNGQVIADAAKSPADPGRGEAAGRAGPLPGQPGIGGQRPGEVELDAGSQDKPGPAVGRGGIAEPRGGPAQPLCGRSRHSRHTAARADRSSQLTRKLGNTSHSSPVGNCSPPPIATWSARSLQLSRRDAPHRGGVPYCPLALSRLRHLSAEDPYRT